MNATLRKNIILRTYKEGAFNCVDFQFCWGGTTYHRESYSTYTWYEKKYNSLEFISKDLQEQCEREYQKLRRIEKLERICENDNIKNNG
jgi:hypothetical protein